MLVSRSNFLVRSWRRFATPRLEWTHANSQNTRTRRVPPGLEMLEDRTLLSTWVPKGPAPILGSSAPGGDPSSGRITGLAADPADPNTIYIAAAGGGVWKTADGGTNWTPLTDSQQTLFMGAIALAPS